MATEFTVLPGFWSHPTSTKPPIPAAAGMDGFFLLYIQRHCLPVTQKQQAKKVIAGKMWDNHFNFVFTDTLGKNLVRRTVVKHFKKIIQRAEISDDARFHDLRHSFAVTSLYAGDDIKTVQTNLGHATAQFTLDTYGHVTQKMRQDSANRMQHFYEQLSK